MDIVSHYLLTLLICLPAIGAISVLALRGRAWTRWIALGLAVLTFALSLSFLLIYDWHQPPKGVPVYACRDAHHSTGVVQFVQRIDLISPLHIQYLVGIDGLSLPLVLLTAFICIRACVACWKTEPQTDSALAACLLAESAFLGLFLSLNFVFFLAFFATTCLPIARMIANSSPLPNRIVLIRYLAAMLVSVTILLLAMLAIHHAAGSFDLVALPALLRDRFPTIGFGLFSAKTLFILLTAAFLIRMGCFPMHRWLSDIYAGASIPAGMFVSALMPASGAYGILRIAYPLFPDAAASLWQIIALIGVASLLFGALTAMRQQSVRRLIACISTSQMGLIVLATAVLTPDAMYGATFMLVAHGITIAMLLAIAGIISWRLGHDDISRLGGLALTSPGCSGFAVTAFLAAMGTPMLAGFVAELLILTGAFQSASAGSRIIVAGHASVAAVRAFALLSCLGTLLLASALASKMARVFFDAPRREHSEPIELTHREITLLTPMLVALFLFGVLPTPLYFAFVRTTLDALFKL